VIDDRLAQQKHNRGVMTMAHFPYIAGKFSLFPWEIFPPEFIRLTSGKVPVKIEKLSWVF
jgi:hypothetical protein